MAGWVQIGGKGVKSEAEGFGISTFWVFADRIHNELAILRSFGLLTTNT